MDQVRRQSDDRRPTITRQRLAGRVGRFNRGFMTRKNDSANGIPSAASPAREARQALQGLTSTGHDQTLSDRDQTASDADQTSADTDAGASARDQADSDRDQAISDKDQETEDHGEGSAASAASREASRSERAKVTTDRTATSIARGRSGSEREATAKARDHAATDRDRTSTKRDERAASFDSGDTSLASASIDLEALRVRAAADRAAAAKDRARAAADREAAAKVRAELEAQLVSAHLDDLTGAYRREMGHLALAHEIDRARRGDGRFVVVFVDVDGLKAINDEQSHAAGDAALVAVVAEIQKNLRSFDPVLRYGGDEFVAGMAGMDLDQVERRFAGIQAALRAGPGVGVSIGVAGLKKDETVDELVARADDELYRRRGRTRPPEMLAAGGLSQSA